MNVLRGGPSADMIYGGSETDDIDGRGGADIIDAGEGDDIISWTVAGPVYETLIDNETYPIINLNFKRITVHKF